MGHLSLEISYGYNKEKLDTQRIFHDRTRQRFKNSKLHRAGRRPQGLGLQPHG